MMELKIYSPQDTGFIQKIDWNYDELKKEIAAAIESYANSVYTDDMIKKAKEDRAKLCLLYTSFGEKGFVLVRCYYT